MAREVLALGLGEALEPEDVVDDVLAVDAHLAPARLVACELAQRRDKRVDIRGIDRDAVGPRGSIASIEPSSLPHTKGTPAAAASRRPSGTASPRPGPPLATRIAASAQA